MRTLHLQLLLHNIYIYVGSVQYVVSLLFASICYFLITQLTFLIILCMFVFLFCMFVFCFVYSGFLYCFYFLLCSCLFPIFVQVYRPLPPGGNLFAVNKYHISYKSPLIRVSCYNTSIICKEQNFSVSIYYCGQIININEKK